MFARNVTRVFVGTILLPAVLTGCRLTKSPNPFEQGPVTPLTNGPSTAKAGEPEKELPAKESAKLCLTLAESMEQNGHDLEAAAEFEKARQHDPKLKVSRRLGMAYERLGEFKSAQTEYERAAKEDPKDAAPHNDLGYLHYSRGKFAEAEKHLRDAIALNPKYDRAWINLGLTLGQQRKYDESLEAFQKAVSPGEAYANLAFVFLSQGKREEAKQSYREALKRDPDLRVARTALAKLDASSTLPASTTRAQDQAPVGSQARQVAAAD